jgi:hypothetical protein
MFVSPSSGETNPDAARFHAQDVHRDVERDRAAQAELMIKLRRLVRRTLGRQTPPESP